MAIFDYITIDEFRKSLESDYQEMTSCFTAEAWKAVHVLAGSIIEAVLLDYLVSEGIVSQDEAVKMDLGNAISLCKEKKIISIRTSELSSVIKSYRNLIHPGRIIRMNESVDRNSAEVTKALVSIVVGEIEGKKREQYGYTAEQIVSKILRDSSVDSIIPHIVKQANSAEIEKLLLRVLPTAYLDYLQDDVFDENLAHLPDSFSLCFRIAFEQATDNIQKKVAQNFVRIIKEESQGFLFAYGKAFFRASDMTYLVQDDIDITKKYLLARLENDVDGWLATISGISPFLVEDDVNKFVDPLVKAVNSRDNQSNLNAEKLLIEEGFRAFGITTEILKRLDSWINFYRERDQNIYAEKIEHIRADIDIPF